MSWGLVIQIMEELVEQHKKTPITHEEWMNWDKPTIHWDKFPKTIK